MYLLHAHVELSSHGVQPRRRHAGAGRLHGGRHQKTPSYVGSGVRESESPLSLEGEMGISVPLQLRRPPARARGWRRQSVGREQTA